MRNISCASDLENGIRTEPIELIKTESMPQVDVLRDSMMLAKESADSGAGISLQDKLSSRSLQYARFRRSKSDIKTASKDDSIDIDDIEDINRLDTKINQGKIRIKGGRRKNKSANYETSAEDTFIGEELGEESRAEDEDIVEVKSYEQHRSSEGSASDEDKNINSTQQRINIDLMELKELRAMLEEINISEHPLQDDCYEKRPEITSQDELGSGLKMVADSSKCKHGAADKVLEDKESLDNNDSMKMSDQENEVWLSNIESRSASDGILSHEENDRPDSTSGSQCSKKSSEVTKITEVHFKVEPPEIYDSDSFDNCTLDTKINQGKGRIRKARKHGGRRNDPKDLSSVTNLEISQSAKNLTKVLPSEIDDSDCLDTCTLDTTINQGKGRIRKARKPGARKLDSTELKEHEKSDDSENSNKARHRIDIDLLELKELSAMLEESDNYNEHQAHHAVNDKHPEVISQDKLGSGLKMETDSLKCEDEATDKVLEDKESLDINDSKERSDGENEVWLSNIESRSVSDRLSSADEKVCAKSRTGSLSSLTNLDIRQNSKSNTKVVPTEIEDSDCFKDFTLDTKINQGKGRIRKARKPGAKKVDANDLEEPEKSDDSENSYKVQRRINSDLLELQELSAMLEETDDFERQAHHAVNDKHPEVISQDRSESGFKMVADSSKCKHEAADKVSEGNYSKKRSDKGIQIWLSNIDSCSTSDRLTSAEENDRAKSRTGPMSSLTNLEIRQNPKSNTKVVPTEIEDSDRFKNFTLDTKINQGKGRIRKAGKHGAKEVDPNDFEGPEKSDYSDNSNEVQSRINSDLLELQELRSMLEETDNYNEHQAHHAVNDKHPEVISQDRPESGLKMVADSLKCKHEAADCAKSRTGPMSSVTNLVKRQNPKSNTEVGPPESDDSDSFDNCTLDTKINQGKGRIRKARKHGAKKVDSNDLEGPEKSDVSVNSKKVQRRINSDLLELQELSAMLEESNVCKIGKIGDRNQIHGMKSFKDEVESCTRMADFDHSESKDANQVLVQDEIKLYSIDDMKVSTDEKEVWCDENVFAKPDNELAKSDNGLTSFRANSGSSRITEDLKTNVLDPEVEDLHGINSTLDTKLNQDKGKISKARKQGGMFADSNETSDKGDITNKAQRRINCDLLELKELKALLEENDGSENETAPMIIPEDEHKSATKIEIESSKSKKANQVVKDDKTLPSIDDSKKSTDVNEVWSGSIGGQSASAENSSDENEYAKSGFGITCSRKNSGTGGITENPKKNVPPKIEDSDCNDASTLNTKINQGKGKIRKARTRGGVNADSSNTCGKVDASNQAQCRIINSDLLELKELNAMLEENDGSENEMAPTIIPEDEYKKTEIGSSKSKKANQVLKVKETVPSIKDDKKSTYENEVWLSNIDSQSVSGEISSDENEYAKSGFGLTCSRKNSGTSGVTENPKKNVPPKIEDPDCNYASTLNTKINQGKGKIRKARTRGGMNADSNNTCGKVDASNQAQRRINSDLLELKELKAMLEKNDVSENEMTPTIIPEDEDKFATKIEIESSKSKKANQDLKVKETVPSIKDDKKSTDENEVWLSSIDSQSVSEEISSDENEYAKSGFGLTCSRKNSGTSGVTENPKKNVPPKIEDSDCDDASTLNTKINQGKGKIRKSRTRGGVNADSNNTSGKVDASNQAQRRISSDLLELKKLNAMLEENDLSENEILSTTTSMEKVEPSTKLSIKSSKSKFDAHQVLAEDENKLHSIEDKKVSSDEKEVWLSSIDCQSTGREDSSDENECAKSGISLTSMRANSGSNRITEDLEKNVPKPEKEDLDSNCNFTMDTRINQGKEKIQNAKKHDCMNADSYETSDEVKTPSQAQRRINSDLLELERLDSMLKENDVSENWTNEGRLSAVKSNLKAGVEDSKAKVGITDLVLGKNLSGIEGRQNGNETANLEISKNCFNTKTKISKSAQTDKKTVSQEIKNSDNNGFSTLHSNVSQGEGRARKLGENELESSVIKTSVCKISFPLDTRVIHVEECIREEECSNADSKKSEEVEIFDKCQAFNKDLHGIDIDLLKFEEMNAMSVGDQEDILREHSSINIASNADSYLKSVSGGGRDLKTLSALVVKDKDDEKNEVWLNNIDTNSARCAPFSDDEKCTDPGHSMKGLRTDLVITVNKENVHQKYVIGSTQDAEINQGKEQIKAAVTNRTRIPQDISNSFDSLGETFKTEDVQHSIGNDRLEPEKINKIPKVNEDLKVLSRISLTEKSEIWLNSIDSASSMFSDRDFCEHLEDNVDSPEIQCEKIESAKIGKTGKDSDTFKIFRPVLDLGHEIARKIRSKIDRDQKNDHVLNQRKSPKILAESESRSSDHHGIDKDLQEMEKLEALLRENDSDEMAADETELNFETFTDNDACPLEIAYKLSKRKTKVPLTEVENGSTNVEEIALDINSVATKGISQEDDKFTRSVGCLTSNSASFDEKNVDNSFEEKRYLSSLSKSRFLSSPLASGYKSVSGESTGIFTSSDYTRVLRNESVKLSKGDSDQGVDDQKKQSIHDDLQELQAMDSLLHQYLSETSDSDGEFDSICSKITQRRAALNSITQETDNISLLSEDGIERKCEFSSSGMSFKPLREVMRRCFLVR